MTLIRLLTLRSLEYNFRVFSRHIKGEDNFLSDSLSRLDIEKFRRQAKNLDIQIQPNPTPISDDIELWPLSAYWKKHCAQLKK